MKGLDVKDLKPGHVYRCLISGKDVLYFEGNSIKGQVMYFDTGSYKYSNIQDGQLIEIPENAQPAPLSGPVNEKYEQFRKDILRSLTPFKHKDFGDVLREHKNHYGSMFITLFTMSQNKEIDVELKMVGNAFYFSAMSFMRE